jgi:hypothetical protein
MLLRSWPLLWPPHLRCNQAQVLTLWQHQQEQGAQQQRNMLR